jgi:hypothetical protein
LEIEEKRLSEKRVELKKKRFQIELKRNKLAKAYPYLRLSYICNFPETEEEYLKKSWW